jgi:tRNA(fMet)-specific endonuclease VapC
MGLADLIRNPQGRIATHIARVGEGAVCTSLVVAAELRYGAGKKASARLTEQVERVLGALDVLPLERPTDVIYGELRAQLEAAGLMIGGNELLIASQALSLGYTIVTDNEREFSRATGLALENWLRTTF